MGWGSPMASEAEMAIRAAKLRNTPTAFEKVLWQHLSRSQLGGFKFRRQHVIGNRIVDFYCPQKALVIEIDGNTHDAAKDAHRDSTLAQEGYAILRFTNIDVGQNIEGVLEAILRKLTNLPDRWAGDSPTPTPPLKGRGS